MLCGCAFEQNIEDISDQYRQRLANVLDVPGPQYEMAPPLPGLDKLSLSHPGLDISIRDFYQMRDCRIYTLVAERNTSLGKIQAASQRYLYELDLLQALQECRKTTDTLSLQIQLDNWLQHKQSALEQHWQQLLQSDEIQQSLSRNLGYIGDTTTDHLSETRQSLQYLLSIHPASPERLRNTQLESHLQQLKQTRLMARVFRTQRLLLYHLPPLTHWLEQQSLKCSGGKPSKQVEYLRNVFGLFFIDQIQPLAGRTNDIYYQLMPLWQSLLSAHPPMSAWLTEREAEFQQYRQALSQHIQFWQRLLEQCNLAPAGANQTQT